MAILVFDIYITKDLMINKYGGTGSISEKNYRPLNFSYIKKIMKIMGKFTNFMKYAAAAGAAAYTAKKLKEKNQKWAFECRGSRCGHYEERSGNNQFKRVICPKCGWNIRAKRII